MESPPSNYQAVVDVEKDALKKISQLSSQEDNTADNNDHASRNKRRLVDDDDDTINRRRNVRGPRSCIRLFPVPVDPFTSHLLLVTSNEGQCRPLVRALLQASSSSRSSLSTKGALAALARVLADDTGLTSRKRMVHVVQGLTTNMGQEGEVDSHQFTPSEFGRHVDHVAMVVSAKEVALARLASSPKNNNISNGNVNSTSNLLWSHPLVQQTLTCLEIDDGLPPPQRQQQQQQQQHQLPLFQQRISLIVLLQPDDENDEDERWLLLQLQRSSRAVSNSQQPTQPQKNHNCRLSLLDHVPVLICRPHQVSSCQMVAQMLWKRLDLGTRRRQQQRHHTDQRC